MKRAAEKSQAETLSDLNARCDGPNQFENFDNAVRQALTVSKDELEKRSANWKRQQARKKHKKMA